MAEQTFTAVDLSRLPAPAVVEELSFETILTEMLAELRARDPSFTATVESDPAYKILEVCAYRETLIRARVNDAARSIMLAYATGSDLDHLAAVFGVSRLLIAPANALSGTPDVFENDVDLRRRVTLAPEGYSVAGPEGAYIFHALSADPLVLDASCESPQPGRVVVTILSRQAEGAASNALLNAVTAALNADTVRPLTDEVLVQSATLIDYEVVAQISTFAGPDAALVLAASNSRLAALIEDNRRLGRDITRSAIFAALHAPGVHRVALISPPTDIIVNRDEVAVCTARAVTHAGAGE